MYRFYAHCIFHMSRGSILKVSVTYPMSCGFNDLIAVDVYMTVL